MSDFTTKIEDTMAYEGSGKVGMGPAGNRGPKGKGKGGRVKPVVGKRSAAVKKVDRKPPSRPPSRPPRRP